LELPHAQDGSYDGPQFLKALADWKRNGNYEAAESLKGILGTSAATGAAIVPNNFVGLNHPVGGSALHSRRLLRAG
jgi:hypothetical protein